VRLVFAGTPTFAVRPLVALLEAGHEVVLVLAQPDRPAGRGLRIAPGPVAAMAAARGLALFQPRSLRDADAQARILAAKPDAIVVAAYGLILPKEVLAAAPHGAVNVHASLLPRWRGAAPIQRALLAGDRETGVSIMRMDEGLDTGPVYARRAIAIAEDDDAGTLGEKLSGLGAELLVEVLAQIASGQACAVAQRADGVTWAAKIERSECTLDWRRPASELERKVRALRPAPGAHILLHGQPVKVWRARLASEAGDIPGLVLASGPSGLRIACGEGSLELLELQWPGSRRLPAVEFLRGRPVAAGTRLGSLV